MSIVIHHHPECGTSRNVLDIIRAAGEQPTVIEYLECGWTRPQLMALFAATDLTPRTALRTTKSSAEALGLLERLPPGPLHKEDGTPILDERGERVV